MQNRPIIVAMRPEGYSNANNHRLNDYPVRLLTRRTLGLYADDLLELRRNAPRHVSCALWFRPTRHLLH